jgi:hypothetical protein
MDAEVKKLDAQPLWDAFAVREDLSSKKTYWTRVGRAFINSDGSYNIYLDAIPLGGKMQIRPHVDKPLQGDLPLKRPEPWTGAQHQ